MLPYSVYTSWDTTHLSASSAEMWPGTFFAQDSAMWKATCQILQWCMSEKSLSLCTRFGHVESHVLDLYTGVCLRRVSVSARDWAMWKATCHIFTMVYV